LYRNRWKCHTLLHDWNIFWICGKNMYGILYSFNGRSLFVKNALNNVWELVKKINPHIVLKNIQMYKSVLDYYGNMWKKWDPCDHADCKIITYKSQKIEFFWTLYDIFRKFWFFLDQGFLITLHLFYHYLLWYHVSDICAKLQKKMRIFFTCYLKLFSLSKKI